MSIERPQSPDAKISDLRRRVVDEPGLQAELLKLLERKGLSGAIVPVEVSHPADEVGPQQPPEHRWVEWKRVFRPKTAEELAESKDQEKDIEIPGSIEKILVVNLLDLSIHELITAGHYNADLLSDDLTDADRAAPRLTGARELLLPKFERTVRTAEIEEWFKANDLLGATLQELLSIGAQFPEEQFRVYLVCLGEASRERGRVFVLRVDIPGRIVLRSGDEFWLPNARLVAARAQKNALRSGAQVAGG